MSARFHPSPSERPRIKAVVGTCRLKMPPAPGVLNCGDVSHHVEAWQNCLAKAVQTSSRSTLRASVSMTSGAILPTDRSIDIGYFSVKSLFPYLKPALEIVTQPAFHDASCSSHDSVQFGWSATVEHVVKRQVTGRSLTRAVCWKLLSPERLARGNTPSTWGSHEERNAYQRPSAGRKPDWCR